MFCIFADSLLDHPIEATGTECKVLRKALVSVFTSAFKQAPHARSNTTGDTEGPRSPKAGVQRAAPVFAALLAATVATVERFTGGAARRSSWRQALGAACRAARGVTWRTGARCDVGKVGARTSHITMAHTQTSIYRTVHDALVDMELMRHAFKLQHARPYLYSVAPLRPMLCLGHPAGLEMTAGMMF